MSHKRPERKPQKGSGTIARKVTEEETTKPLNGDGGGRTEARKRKAGSHDRRPLTITLTRAAHTIAGL
jgi:hypothetical protein